MKQTKTRAFSWLLMLVMAFSLISPGMVKQVNAEETKAFDGYVYVTVEKFTLGQGFVQEPIKVGYYESENLENVLRRGLGDNMIGMSSEYGLYVTGFKDGGESEGWTKDQIPAKILEKLEAASTTITPREKDDVTLDGGEYTQTSFYSLTVDNLSAQSGATGITYEADTEDGTSYHNGSVVRFQYSLYGWGGDLNTAYGDKLIEFPDKDDLIADVAESQSYENSSVYKNAMSVLEKWDATAQEVTDAETSLDSYKEKLKDYPALSDNYEDVLTKALANRKPSLTDISYGFEWAVLAQARNDNEDDAWYHSYYRSVEQTLAISKDNMIGKAVSDNARTAIAVTAMGLDATDINGKNLLEPLADYSNIKNAYVTTAVYSLIALDCGNYNIPETSAKDKTTRDKLINTILAGFNADGYMGYSWGGKDYDDQDSMAMAIQALAPYYGSNAKVKETVDKALKYLSEKQNADGTFGSGDAVCTTAQVLCALCALDIDAEKDEQFIKNGISAVDAILSYAKEDGSIAVENSYSPAMSTEQAGYALVAYDRLNNKKNGLYEIAADKVAADAFYKCADAKVTVTGAKAATCTEDGYTGDMLCDNCKADVKGLVIPKKGHTVVIDPAIEPTEDKEGKTEGSHCSVCNTVIKAQTTVPKKERKTEQATTTAPTTEAPITQHEVALEKPTGNTIKSTKKKQLKITLKARNDISGYQIQVSTSSKFKNAKIYKVKNANIGSKTIKGLKSKKKYYVRIRTYNQFMENNQKVTIYSKWSKAKKLKVR